MRQVYYALMECLGTPWWLVAFVVSSIYIFYKSNKRMRLIEMIYLIVSIVCVYNGVVKTQVYDRLIGEASYYRFFWMIPFLILCGYAVTLFLWEEKGRFVRIICILVFFGVLFVTSGELVTGSHDTSNIYLVPTDVMQLAEIIASDTQEDMPVIAMSNEMERSYRSYEPNARMGIGRKAQIKFEREGYEIEVDDKYAAKLALAKVVLGVGQVNPVEFLLATKMEQIQYITILKNSYGIDLANELGFLCIGETENYQVYRVAEME